jgi:hypothetical protein
MTKIADATCPSCHAPLDVTETMHPESREPSPVRRLLRRAGRFLIAVSQIGQYMPEPRHAAEPVVERVPRCGVILAIRRSDRRICGQPAPNWRRATDPRRFGPHGGDMGLDVCDDCAARWTENLPHGRDQSEILIDMRSTNGTNGKPAQV